MGMAAGTWTAGTKLEVQVYDYPSAQGGLVRFLLGMRVDGGRRTGGRACGKLRSQYPLG